MKKILLVCLALVWSLGAFAATEPAKKEKKTVTTVFVTDIDCDHCVQKIMNNVPVLGKGIKDVRVDLPKKGVTGVYAAQKSEHAHIVKGRDAVKVKAESKAAGAAKR